MKSAGEILMLGLISDTHNLLRPEAVAQLENSDLIIHAGDIGEQRILEQLKAIAPVVAVRENVDCADWCRILSLTETVVSGAIKIYVIHNLKEIDIDPQAEGFQIVVSGHSHKPLVERKRDVIFINPGSAGKRRFKLPITLAKLEITAQNIEARIIQLC